MYYFIITKNNKGFIMTEKSFKQEYIDTFAQNDYDAELAAYRPVWNEINKMGGPLQTRPITRWFAYSYIPLTIWGASVFAIEGFGLGYLVIAPAQTKEQKTSVQPQEMNFSNFYRNATLFSLAMFCFCWIVVWYAWGVDTKEQNAVKMLLDMKKAYPDVKIDEKAIKKVIKKFPYIISKMSANDRVYFDILKNGKIDIINNPTYRDMALSVISGHLDSHPEDVEYVLAMFSDNKILKQQLLSKKERQQ